jgi:hypothetical protein
MTGLYNGADASVPSKATLPAGTQIVAGYIGGDTPHVWTASEWNQFTGVRYLPIFVDDKESYANGTALGSAMARAAVARGWYPSDDSDPHLVLVVDAEITKAYEYYAEASDRVWELGFVLMQYRSAGSVGNEEQNTPSLTWVADYGQPKPHTTIWGGYQYQPNVHGWDLDVFSQYVYDRCATGPRI